MYSPLLTPAVTNALRPRPRIATRTWAAKAITLPPGSEIKGKIRLDLFPHSAEPLDCFDDRSVRSITLQWASRLGKTILAQICMAKTATHDPHPMAWGDADEKSCRRVLRRLWDILDKVPGLKEKLPPRRLRASDRVQLADCLVHGCWSGSASTAADFAALVIVLNELDKMSSHASREADFADLMTERAKNYLWPKILKISTPSREGDSRIEKARLAGDNRARYVPCPHCQKFQTLRTGNGKDPGGITFDKDSAGRMSVDLAFRTAVYECEHCRNPILDSHRYEMMNAGVWVREGQSIDPMGRVTGEPARPGPDVSFGPLGTHYSLVPSISWGVIAREFVLSRPDPERRRNFRNSWEALTWSRRPQQASTSEIAERLCDDVPIGICPAWSVFLTQFIDVAGETADEFHWQICAWGRWARGHVVDYGSLAGEEALLAHLAGGEYPHADRGRPLRPLFTLIDSGAGRHAEAVYAFCRHRGGVGPSKGMSGFAEFLRFGDLTQTTDRERRDHRKQRRKRVAPPGQRLWETNHERSQNWIQEQLDDPDPRNRPDRFSLPIEFRDGTIEPIRGPFLQHLVNEVPGKEYYKHGNRLTEWERLGPNEQRDCARGNRALADHLTQDGRQWPHLERRPPQDSPASASPGLPSTNRFTTPDGRPFLATER